MILAFILRIICLDNILIDDEPFFYITTYKSFTIHPPVTFLLMKLFVIPHNLDVIWTIRLMPLLFGLISIYLTYYLARMIYNKKTALIASALMAVSFWQVLASSMLDINGSVVVPLYLLAFIFFYKYLKKEEPLFLGMTALMVCLTVLTKYLDALILCVILCTVYIFDKKDFRKTIMFGLIIGLSALATLGLFALFCYIFGYWENFMSTIAHSTLSSKGFTLRPFYYLLFYATPMILFPSLINWKEENRSENRIFAIWYIVVFLMLFVIIRSSVLPFGRYLMTMVPPMCILTADFISNIRFRRKHYMVGLASIVFFLIVFNLSNISGNTFVPHSGSNYLAQLTSLNFSFMFPFIGSSGPAFWISFKAMFIMITISSILFIIYSLRNKHLIFLAMFFGITLAFNMFLIQEYGLALTAPDVTDVSNKLIDYYNENSAGLPDHIITNGFMESIGLYIDGIYLGDNIKEITYYSPYDEKINIGDSKLPHLEGKAVILVDFPTIDKSSEDWKKINDCKRVFTANDKGIESGWIFVC